MPLPRKCLYLPADHFVVAEQPLYEVAEAFANQGGKLLCVGKIHKVDAWARDLKSILDTFGGVEVLVTGSSLLHLQRGSHDLSRRVVMHRVEGFSFREFLELRHGITLPVFDLGNLVGLQEKMAEDVVRPLRDRGVFILEEFRHFLESGFYPYFIEFEDLESFQITLQQSVRATLEAHLPQLHPSLTGSTVARFCRLLSAVAANVPFTPDLTKLRNLLHIADDRTLARNQSRPGSGFRRRWSHLFRSRRQQQGNPPTRWTKRRLSGARRHPIRQRQPHPPLWLFGFLA